MATDHKDVSDVEVRQGSLSSARPDMSMMRIAVAGTGGLARLIAHYLKEDTSHYVVILSRSAQPQLTASGYQVSVVNYSDAASLTFALRGIDTLISTVTGPNQISLIQAAVAARVRRFAPAEFEGPPQLRPANDPLDRGRSVARQWLVYYAQNIQSTTFVCGILYERFQPGGLRQSGIGVASGFGGEGDYIMNCRYMTAEAPAYDANNLENVTICLTAAHDVGRFVTRAIDMRQWPAELRMRGERLRVKDLVESVQQMKGQMFNPLQWHNPFSLRSDLQLAIAQQDNARIWRLHALLATAEGRYDFADANLNRQFPEIRPMSFRDWFVAKWSNQQ